MSDEEDGSSRASTSSDESEDVRVTGLVATRAKRNTAGNKYEATLGEYDDPELQALFAEEDGESDDYESSDPDGDDEDAMDSSSSDEDAGPPQDGQQEDLEGEKELKKAERAEQNRKRKAQQAKLTVPAFAKKTKRVKLAEEVHADDGSSSAIEVPLKKKKVERKDWRASGDDLPTRQSTRTSAVAFRETIHVNLQESAERSRKHKTALHETMKRERAIRRTDITLEERIEMCRAIEKETEKELGRFEREEAERVRLREEALMAKRRRVLEGPLIRTLTTSALYENGKLKVKRLLHGSQAIEDIMTEHAQHQIVLPEVRETGNNVEPPAAETPSAQQPLTGIDPLVGDGIEADGQQLTIREEEGQASGASEEIHNRHDQATRPPTEERSGSTDHGTTFSQVVEDATNLKTESEVTDAGSTLPLEDGPEKDVQPTQQVQAPVSWLSGIHEYAATPTIKIESTGPDGEVNSQHLLHGNAIAPTTASHGQAATPLTPSAPEPIVREQAQRHLIVLEDYPSLEGIATRRTKATSVLEPTAVAQVLMPDSYPTFTDEEAAYLRKTRKLKQELHPKPLCALTSWEGKYRDPKTGIVFADVPAYKMLQRLIAGGCNWNSMLQCWSAPFVGMIGRPASGVPEGFDRSAAKPATDP